MASTRKRWSLLRHHTLPLIGLLMIFECIKSLKLLELRVPTHVALGTRASLSCRWQLGPHDVLYSVKWYKDGKEFFRHVPRDLEPRRKFPLPGVDVEDYDSSGSNLTLAPSVLETEGRYRCEVSGEKPLFPTVSDHADIMVFVLPDHGPMLSGFRSRYKVGDRVQVNCTSGKSRPATKLTWYVNGEPAPAFSILHSTYEETGELHASSLLLKFTLQPKHFKSGEIKVKCLATLGPLYWRSNEESASIERNIKLTVEERIIRADRVHSNQGKMLSCSLKNTVVTLIYLSIPCFMKGFKF